MDRVTLRRVQLAQLDIAKEIKRVCDENGINYFLDSGTLIGAVRHKGFIPWDDDMDIGMLRCDYEKFIKTAPMKLNEEYFIDCWDNNPICPYSFAKVRKKGTMYVESIAQESQNHHELYVDVLPYDSFPDDSKKAKTMRANIKKWNNVLFMKTKMAPWKRHKSIVAKVLVYIKYLPSMVIARANSVDSIRKKYLKVMTQYSDVNTRKVFEEYGALSGRHPISRKCFDAFTELEFEGELFKAPLGYDEVLRSIYGDYMQLPPEDQRENRHQVIEIKL